MMIKVIDTRGKERFVNAAYIRSVTPKGANRSQIDYGGMGGSIKIDRPAQEVAEVVNAALPSSFDEYLAATDVQNQTNQTAQTATMIAVIG